MRIRVDVSDVNGGPLPAARIKVSYPATGTGPELTTVTLAPGEVRDVSLALNQLEVDVSMDGFADERFLFAGSGAGWWSSNPAGQAVQHGAQLDLATTIGTVRLAPATSVRPDQKVIGNPRAALVDDGGGGNWIYRGAFHNDETIRLLGDPIFGDLTAMEWKRFNHSRVHVPLARHGQFVLLEFGPSQPVAGGRLPRFLVATWVPFKPLAAVPEVVVFYSPPTFANRGFPPDAYPFLGDYPYAVTRPAALDSQPYVDVVVNYLLTGYKIIYQLLAAGRNPIMIMPSQSSANWGPLDTQPGLARLVKEVIRFLYARQLVSSRTAPLARLRLTGGRSSVFPPQGRRSDERVPRAFTATLSGFSAGINAVVKACTASRLDEKLYPPALFHAPPGDLMDNWRELWDIDGVDAKGWEHMTGAFNGWLSQSARRTLRSYHSQDTYRAAQNGLVPQHLVVRKPRVPVKGVFAEQGQTTDARVTWVHFSNAALQGDKKAPGHEVTIPEFGSLDAHHFVPAIAFGHAAGLPLR